MILPIYTDGGGTVRIWVETDTRTYHDETATPPIVRPLTDAEVARLTDVLNRRDLRAQIAARIDTLTARAATARTLQQQWADRADAITETTPTLTVAYVTQIRNELATAADRDAQIAGTVADVIDGLVALARIVSGRLS